MSAALSAGGSGVESASNAWGGVVFLGLVAVVGTVALLSGRQERRVREQARRDLAQWSDHEYVGRAHSVLIALTAQAEATPGGAVPRSAIATALDWEDEHLDAVLQALVEEGLVAASSDGGADTRAVYTLTDPGSAFAERLLHPQTDEARTSWLGILTQAQLDLHVALRLVMSVLLQAPLAAVVTRDQSTQWLVAHARELVARLPGRTDTEAVEDLTGTLQRALESHQDSQRVAERLLLGTPAGVRLRSVVAEPDWDEVRDVVDRVRQVEGHLYEHLRADSEELFFRCYWRLREIDSRP